MSCQQPPVSAQDGAPRSDDEIRAIAKRLVHEHDARPQASPRQQLSAAAQELSPADEERVDDALVELRAVEQDATMRATGEAAGKSGPRPKAWGLDDDR